MLRKLQLAALLSAVQLVLLLGFWAPAQAGEFPTKKEVKEAAQLSLQELFDDFHVVIERVLDSMEFQ